jgi:surface protein
MDGSPFPDGVEEIEEGQNDASLFKIRPISGELQKGLYHIIAVGKKPSCARYVGAPGCGKFTKARLARKDDDDTIIAWNVAYEDAPLPLVVPPTPLSPAPRPAPTPAPAPAPAPAPVPAPQPAPAPIPAPAPQPQAPPKKPPSISVQQTYAYDGAVTVKISEPGDCGNRAIVSYDIQYGTSLANVPVRGGLATVGVALTLPSYGVNTITATAVCSDGSKTQPSEDVEVDNYPVVVPPAFYLGSNGVTVMCPGVPVGGTFILGGVTYTRRDRAGLNALRGAAGTEAELSTSCTTGITDLSYFASDKVGLQVSASFNPDLSTWDTSAVTTMASLFMGASVFNNGDPGNNAAKPLNSWDTSKVTTMLDMFNLATAFNQDVSGWDTGRVTNMKNMFALCVVFNQNIGTWSTARVESMEQMFLAANAFDGNIGTWNTAKVKSMSSMFSGAGSFDQPLNSWTTSSVLDMKGMFSGAATFNQPLNNWDTALVDDMTGMFQNALLFNQDIQIWTANPTNCGNNFASGAAAWLAAYPPGVGGTIKSSPPLNAAMRNDCGP